MIGDETPTIEESVGVEPEAAAPEVARVRLGRWIALVVVAALLFVGTAIAAVSASSSRSEAVSERDRSSTQVARERRATRDAQNERDVALREAQALHVAIADPMASVSNLVQLADQGLAAREDAQRSGPEPSVAAVEAYNEAVARANAVGDQFDAAIDRLTDQIRTLVGAPARSV